MAELWMPIHTLKFWSQRPQNGTPLETVSWGGGFSYSEVDVTLVGKRNPDNKDTKKHMKDDVRPCEKVDSHL